MNWQGKNITVRASRNYLPALLIKEGKNSVKYMRPHELFSFGSFSVFMSFIQWNLSHNGESFSNY